MAKNNLNKKCRTCLKDSKSSQLLTKMITEKKGETKSFADFLKDITGVDILNETFGEMPQTICGYCIRKLKASYGFVQQVKEVHNKLWTMFNEVDNIDENCLQEVQIDLNNFLQIKREEVDNVTGAKKPAELITEDENEANISKNGTKNTSKINLRKTDVEDKFVQNTVPESTTAKLNGSMSEFEYVNEGKNFINPEKPADSDGESKSSNESGWGNTTNQSKKVGKKNINDNIPTSCDQCDRVFLNSRLLRRHKSRTHVPEELKVQCPFCPAKYARRYYMYAHMRTQHKDKPIEDHVTIQHRKFPRQYPCEQCDGNYTSKYYLMSHIKSKHNPESSPKQPERILLPKKRFLCALCGSKFESPSNLKVHIRRHTKEKPFKCDLCDRTFYRPCDVQVHRRSHTGEKPFICKICKKGFAKSGKLKVHMRAHSNDRPYKCDQCEKAFKDSKNLKIHKRLHTGERPYTCSICHSGFIKSTSLKLHKTKLQHFEEIDQIAS